MPETALVRFSRILLGIAWAALLAVLAAVAVDSIVAKPGTDASIYIYVAQGILEGEIPYLDRWDHKGPLLYVLNLCGLLIHGTWGPWLVQGIFLFALAPSHFSPLDWHSVPFRPSSQSPSCSLFTPPGNLSGQYGLLFQCLTFTSSCAAKSSPSLRREGVGSIPSTLPLARSGPPLFSSDPTL